MISRPITEHSLHDEVSVLLPWYVNGTLHGSQKTLVEEHARNCIACRRELAIEARTLAAFRDESPVEQTVHAGFERLHRRITARAASRSRTSPAGTAGLVWNRVLDMLDGFIGARVPSALVAAPLVLVALAVGLLLFPLQSPPGSDGTGPAAAATGGFQTLSSPAAGTAHPDDVRVVFTRGTSIETIDTLLDSLPAKIIDGPNNAGIYTVRLSGVSGGAGRQAAILGLRSRSDVLFAEAAQPLSQSSATGAQPQ